MGLYYPYVHFRDKDWLKAAALYWPKIARIVPDGYPIHDDLITQALKDELDFVVNIPPDSAKTDAGRLMLEALVSGGRHLRDEFKVPSASLIGEQNNYRLAVDNWADFLHSPNQAATWLSREKLIDWHRPWPAAALRGARVSRELRHVLVHENMAIQDDPWLGVHPRWAWVYMCVLAEQLAKCNNLSPVTDQILAHAETNGWTPERIIEALHDRPHSPASKQAPETAIGMLAIRLVVPARLVDVPVKKIIQLRQRYGADFDAFHDAVEAVAAELCTEFMDIAERKVLEAYLHQEVKRHFERPLMELHKVIKGIGIDTAFAAANMKFALPSAIVTGGAIAAHQPVLAGAGAAAFGVLTLGRAAQLNWAERAKPSAASYLWRIERGITPESLIRSLLPRKRPRRRRSA